MKMKMGRQTRQNFKCDQVLGCHLDLLVITAHGVAEWNDVAVTDDLQTPKPDIRKALEQRTQPRQKYDPPENIYDFFRLEYKNAHLSPTEIVRLHEHLRGKALWQARTRSSDASALLVILIARVAVIVFSDCKWRKNNCKFELHLFCFVISLLCWRVRVREVGRYQDKLTVKINRTKHNNARFI